mmetsp:Transcript_11335/g.27506  ORF Transcript_11335/g.27506 Transcript_11335/m.27506 type:complete len:264 (-) Transcript_11335:360-1151(-)
MRLRFVGTVLLDVAVPNRGASARRVPAFAPLHFDLTAHHLAGSTPWSIHRHSPVVLRARTLAAHEREGRAAPPRAGRASEERSARVVLVLGSLVLGCCPHAQVLVQARESDGSGAFVAVEKEGRGHHRHRGQRHGEAGGPGREEEARGVEDARGDGDADCVEAEGPDEVEQDPVVHHRGEVQGREDVREVTAHQHHVRRLACHVRPRPDRHAEIRLGECWGVVDSIAHHRDHVPFRLQILDASDLVPWHHASLDVTDAQLPRD